MMEQKGIRFLLTPAKTGSASPQTHAAFTTSTTLRIFPNQDVTSLQHDQSCPTSLKVKEEPFSPYSLWASPMQDLKVSGLSQSDDLSAKFLAQDEKAKYSHGEQEKQHQHMYADILFPSTERDKTPDDEVLEAAGILANMQFGDITTLEQEAAEAMLHLSFMYSEEMSEVPSNDLDGDFLGTSENCTHERRDQDRDNKMSDVNSLPGSPEVKAGSVVFASSRNNGRVYPPPSRGPSIARYAMQVGESSGSPPQKEKRPYQPDQTDLGGLRRSKRVKRALEDKRTVPTYRQERSSIFKLFRN